MSIKFAETQYKISMEAFRVVKEDNNLIIKLNMIKFINVIFIPTRNKLDSALKPLWLTTTKIVT